MVYKIKSSSEWKSLNSNSKLAIVGSRSLSTHDHQHLIMEKLYGLLSPYSFKVMIVSGGAKGVDTIAKDFANIYVHPLTEFLPEWNIYGKSAGFIRNKKIVDNATHLIAFWDGKSRGTMHSLRLAKEKGIPWMLVTIFSLTPS